MRAFDRGIAAALLAILPACQRPVDQSATAAAAVLAADSAWSASFVKRDMTAYLGFVDSTASVQPPNTPAVTGHKAIQGLVASYFALPGLNGTWHPVAAHASRSGDVAYSSGTCDISWKDPKGKPMTERGKYIYVWRKAGDGNWKMVLESFSSDAPPPGSAGP